MSFLVAGRDKNAPKFTREILVELKAAAEDVGLRDPEAWKSDFGLGYIFRHSCFGLEKARYEHWQGLFQRNYPSESLIKTNFLSVVPQVFGIEKTLLAEQYDKWMSMLAEEKVATSEPASEFVRGVLWADRVWHSYQRDVRLTDPISLEIQAIGSRYNELFGSWAGNLIGFRIPSLYYKFLVANTLGPKAFNKTLSDVELTYLLNKKSR